MKKFDIKDEKVIGYVFLLIGLIIMLYSLLLVLDIAETGTVPVEFIETPATNASTQMNQIGNQTIPSIDMSDIVTPMFPLFNFSIWLAICFFILVVGGRVSLLGVNMMKALVPDIRIVKSETIKKINKDSEKPMHQMPKTPEPDQREE